MKNILLFFLLFSVTCIAQTNTSFDAGMWNTFSIQHDINKKITLTLDQECRIKENYSRINLFYTNIGVAFRVFKNWKIEPAYRHIDKYLIDSKISFRHRLMLDVTYKKKFGNFGISQRARYQGEVRNVLTSERGFASEHYLRLRTAFEYEVNDWLTPYISCELRYQIYAPNSDIIFNGVWHRMRNVVGINLKLNKRNILNFYYLIQNEFNISSPENIAISGIQYTLKI